MKTVAEVLDGAADLLEKPRAWTQNAFSRNLDGSTDLGADWGEGIAASSPVCWCALGAIAATTQDDPTGSLFTAADPRLANKARKFLNEFLGEVVEDWNDDDNRTQGEVVAKLREAATLARQAPTHD